MMYLVLCYALILRLASCHNIEVRKVDTINLRAARNGSSNAAESAFAGYTFDMQLLDNGEAR